MPSTNEVVPAGLTAVIREAGLMFNKRATRLFSVLAQPAACSMSNFSTVPEAIPVIDTPRRASFSHACFHLGLR